MSMPGKPAPGGGTGRRSLIDQTLTRCLNGLENIIVSDAYTKAEKISLLDGHVFNCVNAVLNIIYPLIKNPKYVPLAVVMIEDAIAGTTGTPLTPGLKELFQARKRAINCMKLIANSALVSRRLRVPRAQPQSRSREGEEEGSEGEEESELTYLDLRQLATGTRDIGDFIGTATGIQLLASRVLRLIEEAETELDIVDADVALETAYLTATRLAVDVHVRRAFATSNALTNDFEPDAMACLRKAYEDYMQKLDSLISSVTTATSMVDRAWQAYNECVEFMKSNQTSRCKDMFNERDKNLCARQHCATAVIQVLPSIVERLGASTMTSPQVVY